MLAYSLLGLALLGILTAYALLIIPFANGTWLRLATWRRMLPIAALVLAVSVSPGGYRVWQTQQQKAQDRAIAAEFQARYQGRPIQLKQAWRLPSHSFIFTNDSHWYVAVRLGNGLWIEQQLEVEQEPKTEAK